LNIWFIRIELRIRHPPDISPLNSSELFFNLNQGMARSIDFQKILLVFLFASAGIAAVPIHRAGTEKTENYVSDGVIVGGQHQDGLALRTVRESFTKQSSVERVVLDVSSSGGKTNPTRPGFFHLAIQTTPLRIVIDLEDTNTSMISAQDLTRVFKHSHYFQKPVLITSQEDKTVTLELTLKQPLKFEVFELGSSDKPARIVIDAAPIKKGFSKGNAG